MSELRHSCLVTSGFVYPLTTRDFPPVLITLLKSFLPCQAAFMSTAPDNSYAAAETPERLLELLSAQHDSELSAAEAAELEELCVGRAGEVSEILAGLSRIRRGLQGQPRTPLERDVFRVSELVSGEESAAVRRRGAGRLVPGLVSVLALSLLIGWGLRGLRPMVMEPAGNAVAMREFQTHRESKAPGFVDSKPVEELSRGSSRAGLQARSDRYLLTPGAASGAMGGATMAESPARLLAETESGVQGLAKADDWEVRTVAEVTDWKVVVVRVGRDDREQIVDKVGAVLQRYGLQLESSAKDTDAAWMGVVLTSVGETRQNVIQDVEAAVGTAPVEWNPAEVLSSTREQIIAAVRQSLRSPTESEILSGEVYVAVSSAAGGRDAARPVASVESAATESADEVAVTMARKAGSVGVGGSGGIAAAPGVGSAESLVDRGDAGPLDRAMDQATLVVFEFESATPGGAGSRNVF